jgi:hypothetical protein
MAKPRIPTGEDLEKLRRLALRASVGATMADQGVFPGLFETSGLVNVLSPGTFISV